MADDIQVSDATVIVNNNQWAVVPNTIVFDEGDGEQKILITSKGGGKVGQIYSDDVSTKFGMVKFELRSTLENRKNALAAKRNRNQNTVQLILKGGDATVNLTFPRAAITGKLEFGVGPETNLPVEFQTGQAT